MEHAMLVSCGSVKGVTKNQLDDASNLLLKFCAVSVHKKVRTRECLTNVLAQFFPHLRLVPLDQFLGPGLYTGRAGHRSGDCNFAGEAVQALCLWRIRCEGEKATAVNLAERCKLFGPF